MNREPSIQPRALTTRDLPGVLDLISRCYAEYGLTLDLNDACEAHLHDPIAYFCSSGGAYWVVADESGAVRATVALYLHCGSPPLGELKSMYVDPLWRRRGVGSALARHVIEQSRARGCAVLELWSDTRFEPAHRMYESLGFQRFGRRDLEDSNESAEWGYRLVL